MAEKSTFVKIDRNMVSWRWFQTPNTAHLFLYLVIRANIKDGAFKKITVKRGQLVTSLQHLANETGLTVSQVRTALEHLILTGEIAEDTTHGYRLITLLNYDKYQTASQADSQANRRQIASSVADESHQSKNTRRERIKEDIYIPPAAEEVEAYAQAEGLQLDAQAFLDYNASRGWKGITDWRPLVRRWAQRTAQADTQETDSFGRPIRKEFEDA